MTCTAVFTGVCRGRVQGVYSAVHSGVTRACRGCVESVEEIRKQESTETEEDVKAYVRDVSRHAHTQPHNVNKLDH